MAGSIARQTSRAACSAVVFKGNSDDYGKAFWSEACTNSLEQWQKGSVDDPTAAIMWVVVSRPGFGRRWSDKLIL